MVTRPHLYLSQQYFCAKQFCFVSEAISDLLGTKCVEILDHQPDIVNPLSFSVQPPGKKRLILDLKHINLYAFKRKFRCEDLSVAIQFVSKWLYLFKFDSSLDTIEPKFF